MEKVVTINLNGNSYQLDETAFEALRAYLASAAAALKDNPDKDEILGDIEQAIANKCTAFLGPGKTVIPQAEMARALEEMGPVEDEAEPRAPDEPRPQDAPHEDAAGDKRPRRLYRLPDGAMIAGVASGMAAYFKIDPAVISILFIIAAIVTHGLGVLLYIAAMFIIPSPHTPEEWAAAHNAPFNAQEVIERAKREYEDFTANGGFNSWTGAGGARSARQAWKQARRHTRRAARQARRAMRQGMYWGAHPYAGAPYGGAGYAPPPYAAPVGPFALVVRAFAGLFALVFGLVGAALTIAFLVVLFSLLTTGAVLGWTPPGSLPLWAVLVIVVVAFGVVTGPISAFRRAASHAMTGRGYYHPNGAFDGFVWMGLMILGVWLSYLYVPAAHVWLDHAWAMVNHIATSVSRDLGLADLGDVSDAPGAHGAGGAAAAHGATGAADAPTGAAAGTN